MLRALVFTSERCPYCIYFKGIVKKLKRKFPEIVLEFVDVEQNPELAKRFDIEMLPTTVLLNGDEIVGGFMGFVDERTAERSLRDQLNNLKIESRK